MKPFSRLSLVWKILLSTSFATALLLGITGWLVQRHAVTTTSQMIEDEVRTSFRAYESLWKSRAAMLASVSRVLSAMSDVRAAFGTGDEATIRDTAGELWSRISDANAMFLVTDPGGRIIASLGGKPTSALKDNLPVVRLAADRFPEQTSGFMVQDGELYQIAVTPVYVQSGSGPVLLNVLVAGYRVDEVVVQELKEATGGSEFLFLAGDRVVASTLEQRRTAALVQLVSGGRNPRLVTDGMIEYAPLSRLLLDVQGKPVAQLWIFRSFEAAQLRIAQLRRDIFLMCLAALLAGIFVTYLLAQRIVGPIKKLDQAAAEVARQNYEYRVRVESEDELGRLANTFNTMCASIQNAREELIRQERIATIGLLSTSIVHDLRNPLAAIYGGAEMLVDSDLPMPTVKRLAGNIYRSSQSIQKLLQDLTKVSRGKVKETEVCSLLEVIHPVLEVLQPVAESQGVSIILEVPAEIELSMERGRMERVFLNLITNALEAMPKGGEIRISARREGNWAAVQVEDSGPGIPNRIRGRLFQPFVSDGKKNGLGLGLALSRQTLLDHGGDLWEESKNHPGARFALRIPV